MGHQGEESWEWATKENKACNGHKGEDSLENTIKENKIQNGSHMKTKFGMEYKEKGMI